MNSKGLLFLTMLLASILLISAEKSDKKDDKANGVDESKYDYDGGLGYGGPWRGSWGYGDPWRGDYGWGGPWRGGLGDGYGGWRGGLGGGYGGWRGDWPKEHSDINTDAEPHN